MKKLFVAIPLIFCFIVSQAQFSSARLTAAGLTCAMCTKAIYNALEKIPFVQSVDADIKSSAFIIQFKKEISPDPDLIKAAVENAGFSIAQLTMTGNFKKTAINDDAHVQIEGKTFHFVNVNQKALNGIHTITLADKNYVSPKEYKKLRKSANHACVETGKAEECCARAGVAQNSRIYHVTI